MSDIGVYAIRNRCTGTVYIGSTAKVFRIRWHQHITALKYQTHHNKPLQEDWNTYGAEAFEFIILETVDTKVLLDSLEQRWLDEYVLNGSQCYNYGRVSRRHTRATELRAISFRLSSEVERLIAKLSDTLCISQAAVLTIAIREMAKREGVTGE
jgi:group I intron endonuclease